MTNAARPPAPLAPNKKRRADVVTPVVLSLLLGPGTGQLYNREYKRGFIFIALALVLLVAGFGWFFSVLHRFLPPDLGNTDPAALSSLLADAVDRVKAAHGGRIHALVTGFVLLQGGSAIDAYYGSLRRFQRLDTQSAKEGL